MSYIDQEVFAPIRARLLLNKQARDKRGALIQDFEAKEGEIFLGNFKPAEFDCLPLRTKRKGDPARINRYFSEPAAGAQHMSRVLIKTYAEVHKDKDSFAVFVTLFELDVLGITYE